MTERERLIRLISLRYKMEGIYRTYMREKGELSGHAGASFEHVIWKFNKFTDENFLSLANLSSTDVVSQSLTETGLVRKLPHLILKLGADWLEDSYSPTKGYILACFSEIAYLQLSPFEIIKKKRYKVFPSNVLRDIFEFQIRINISMLISVIEGSTVSTLFTNSFVYNIVETSQFTIVSIRGTIITSLTDWLINVSLQKSNGFHAGFYQEALRILPDLEDRLGKRKNRAGPIYFTGHSLGGAVASVLSSIWRERENLMSPYTFGSPRFHTADLETLVNGYHHVTANDVVPHLPPKRLGFVDTAITPISLPIGQKRLAGHKSLLSGMNPQNSFLKQHKIEKYRHLVGDSIGESFPESTYSDALIMSISRLSD